MNGVQHKRMGVALGIGVLSFSLLSEANPSLALFMVTTPMGVMLPDIDHDNSKLGRTRNKITTLIKIGIVITIIGFLSLSYISGGMWNAILNAIYLGIMAVIINIIERNKHVRKQMGFIKKHRGIMHTLIPPAFIMGTTFWTINEYYFYCIFGLVVGYVVHILGDMATVSGAPLFWPLTKSNIRYLSFDTGKNPMALEIICNLWCLIFIGVGIYFGMGGI